MPAPTSGAMQEPSLARVHGLLDLLPAGACLCAADGRITRLEVDAD